jgi:hypothetical protein
MDYMNNKSETFNGVYSVLVLVLCPCLFSSFKEKGNIKTKSKHKLATPSFKDGGAFSPLSSEPLNTKTCLNTIRSNKKTEEYLDEYQ